MLTESHTRRLPCFTTKSLRALPMEHPEPISIPSSHISVISLPTTGVYTDRTGGTANLKLYVSLFGTTSLNISTVKLNLKRPTNWFGSPSKALVQCACSSQHSSSFTMWPDD